MAFDYAGKIRGLLANAENEALAEDVRQTYRDKAMAFMRQYNIAEEEAIAVDPFSAVPTFKRILLRTTLNAYSDVAHAYPEMIRIITRYTGIRSKVEYTPEGLMATLVGYEGDIAYAEFLWTAAYLMFSTRIDARWNADLPEADNVFYMRNAGIKRAAIADAAWGQGAGQLATNRSKVQRIYLAEAKRRGEEARAKGLGFDSKAYREEYADSFTTTLERRLRHARDAANSVGGALELSGRMDRVDAAYEEMFPPAPRTEMKPWVDPTKDCERCAKAKTTCNAHSYMRERQWTVADQMRLEARQNSSSRAAGRASGAHAAEGVSVTRGHTTARRLDESGRAIEN